jgi:hypothetical protein
LAENRSADNAWTLVLALLVISAFVFAEVLVAHRTIGQAIAVATFTVSLALAACYARAACLAVGRRLGLSQEPIPQSSSAIPLAVIAVVTLEMLMVVTSTMVVHLSDAESLQAAAAVTLLCLKLLYGRAALVAIGRRIFATPADAGN